MEKRCPKIFFNFVSADRIRRNILRRDPGFRGARFSRLGADKAVAADATVGPEKRAHALYRAVRCYAPSGYNGCDSTQAQRKGWFDPLQGQYPTSVWAKKLRYYW